MPSITNDWAEPLQEEYKKEYYRKLYYIVNEEYHSGRTIYPPADVFFNAFHLTPLHDVYFFIIGRVVFLQEGFPLLVGNIVGIKAVKRVKIIQNLFVLLFGLKACSYRNHGCNSH